jgi:hypothetical protein
MRLLWKKGAEMSRQQHLSLNRDVRVCMSELVTYVVCIEC